VGLGWIDMRWNPFKHCCGVAEIGTFYSPAKKNSDNDQRLRELEGEITAKYKGVVICTTNSFQKRTALCLARNGYKVILDFINPNTGNPVKIWLKDLTKTEV
jgi:hypothetical protein